MTGISWMITVQMDNAITNSSSREIAENLFKKVVAFFFVFAQFFLLLMVFLGKNKYPLMVTLSWVLEQVGTLMLLEE
jgi:hypothetical protein